MYLGRGEDRTHFQWEKNYECLGYIMKKIGVSGGAYALAKAEQLLKR